MATRQQRAQLRKTGIILALLTQAGCSTLLNIQDGPPNHWVDIAAIPEPEPQPVSRSRAGNPERYEVDGQVYEVLDKSSGYRATGIASWYGRKFHGRPTATGEIFDMYGISAAHRTLPLPAYARVTNLDNNRSLIVRINDRGPFHPERILDLSYAAAAKLDVIRLGTARVRIETIETQVMTSPGRSAAEAIAKEPRVFLQIGAFSQRDNAERLSAQLQAKLGRDVGIHSQAASDRTLHRVRVGPITSVEEADRLRSHLAALGFHGSHIVTPQDGE